MPDDPRRAEPNEDVKKRAYRRVGAAVALAMIASVGVTFLTHRKPPPAPVAEPEQTVLPSEPPVSAVQTAAEEPPPASAVAETSTAPATLPSVAPPSPPPPPQVVNVSPEVNTLGESTHKVVKPPVTKPPMEKEPESLAKPHFALELAPASVKEAKDMKKPVEARAEPAKPASSTPHGQAESTVKPRTAPESAPVIAAKTVDLKKPAETQSAKPTSSTLPGHAARTELELVPAFPPKEAASKDGEIKKPVEARTEPAKPAANAPPALAAQLGGAGAKGYAVQLGVFTNPTNATQLQEKLTQHGIQSYTETRLNVGTFQNKTEADQAMAKVRGLGIGAVVVPLH